MHYALAFRLSHFCCCVRTDVLPFERDVRRSSRGSVPGEVQALMMALVMACDWNIRGDQVWTSSSASLSAQRSTAPQGSTLGPDGAACRWAALRLCRHGAVRRCDALRSMVVPRHAVAAASVRMECIVCGGVPSRAARCFELWAVSGDRGCLLLVAQTCRGRRSDPCLVRMRVGRGPGARRCV